MFYQDSPTTTCLGQWSLKEGKKLCPQACGNAGAVAPYAWIGTAKKQEVERRIDMLNGCLNPLKPLRDERNKLNNRLRELAPANIKPMR